MIKGRKLSKLLEGTSPIARFIHENVYPELDFIPAHSSFRNFDIKLEQEEGHNALKDLLAPLSEDTSLVILDCPPTLSRLTEQVLEVADKVYVPLVPTWLSLNSWNQLREFVKDKKLGNKKLRPFFSMVDRRKNLHREILDQATELLGTSVIADVPYASVVERMGRKGCRWNCWHLAVLPPSNTGRCGNTFRAILVSAVSNRVDKLFVAQGRLTAKVAHMHHIASADPVMQQAAVEERINQPDTFPEQSRGQNEHQESSRIVELGERHQVGVHDFQSQESLSGRRLHSRTLTQQGRQRIKSRRRQPQWQAGVAHGLCPDELPDDQDQRNNKHIQCKGQNPQSITCRRRRVNRWRCSGTAATPDKLKYLSPPHRFGSVDVYLRRRLLFKFDYGAFEI